MSTTEEAVVVGRRLDNQKMRDIPTEDVFGEAPFYAGGESDAEHLQNVLEGTRLCGIFRGLRESRTANSSGSKSWYICMETTDGDRFRLMAPTQLRNVIEQEAVTLGQYIEMVYEGKREPASGKGQPYHVFQLSLGDTLN